jgi:hypothetical protein
MGNRRKGESEGKREEQREQKERAEAENAQREFDRKMALREVRQCLSFEFLQG